MKKIGILAATTALLAGAWLLKSGSAPFGTPSGSPGGSAPSRQSEFSPSDLLRAKTGQNERSSSPSPLTPQASPRERSFKAVGTTPHRPLEGIPAKPDGNIIEFRVMDGLAVAYGDVLLGKPEPGFQGDRGQTDAPTPQLWEHPEIPYAINPSLPNPGRVEAALEYFRSHTPVKFVPWEGQKDAIVFEPGDAHCYSYLGRQGGPQPIKLSVGCETSEIIHEIMHALGFVHEQSRPDRDQYIEVLWENIEEKYRSQFALVPETFLEALKGATFDYHSIMLYRPNAFAKRSDLVTLRSRGSDPVAPTQAGLSDGDIQRLRRLYDLYP